VAITSEILRFAQDDTWLLDGTREDGAVGPGPAFPAVRPFAIFEVETGFVVCVVESVVDFQGAGLRVEIQEIEPRSSFAAGCDYDAFRDGIPRAPVGEIIVGEIHAGDFDRFCAVGDIENDSDVSVERGLDEKVSDDCGHAAPVTGECVDELRCRVVRGQAGDAFETAGESLHVDRAIGAEARFFGTDLCVTIVTDVEIVGAQEF